MREKSELFELIERLKAAMKYAPIRCGVRLHEMFLMRGLAEAHERGERICITDISEALGVTKSAVSQMIDKLSARGIVRRVPSEENKKVVYIEPTETAKKNFIEEKRRLSNFIDDIVDEMGEDIDELIRLTEKFVGALENVLKKSADEYYNAEHDADKE